MKLSDGHPNPPLANAKSSDFRNVQAAVERAGQRARDVAKQTNTYLVVQQNGQLVKLKVT
jgi:flavin-binding protein dodecin